MEVKIEGGIFAELDFTGETKFIFWGYQQMAGYTKVQPHTITVEIPDDFDPRPGFIAELRKEKTQVLADAQVKANQIEESIQRLLAIECRPAQAQNTPDDPFPF